MSNLKQGLIKLGTTNPELRPHIRPLLAKLATFDREAIVFPSQHAMDKYLKEHPDADRKNHSVVENKDTEDYEDYSVHPTKDDGNDKDEDSEEDRAVNEYNQMRKTR